MPVAPWLNHRRTHASTGAELRKSRWQDAFPPRPVFRGDEHRNQLSGYGVTRGVLCPSSRRRFRAESLQAMFRSVKGGVIPASLSPRAVEEGYSYHDGSD